MDFRFMGYDFTDTQLFVTALVLVSLIIIAAAAFLDRRSAGTLALHNRFGPGHARAVDENGFPRGQKPS